MKELLLLQPGAASRRRVLGVSLALYLLVGVGDTLSGPALNLSIFYLLPIALASWFLDRRTGLFFCLLCAATCFVANLRWGSSYAHYLIPYWNMAARFIFFAAICFLLSKVRALLHVEADLARRDFLTGLPNSRGFYELAALEMKQAAASAHPMTLAYVDVDGLKWVNSRLGPVAGDQSLCRIARIIADSVPRKDLVGRLGGTVFAILLPKTSSAAARYILADLLTALKENRQVSGRPMMFYISAVTYLQSPKTIAELLYEAERVLDRTKENRTDHSTLEVVERAQPLL
jgi:diguanylate cyclase (GGDEF)-like protein